MSHPSLAAILRLSVSERLEIVQEIWDSIATEDAAFVLTPEHLEDLDRRLAEAKADPNGARPWEEVRARLLRQRG
jgi:putative addiction module component (TIGR02574 family)